MVWAGEHNDKEEGFGLAEDFIDEGFGLEDDGDDEGFGLEDENEENSRQLALRLASLGCLVVCISGCLVVWHQGGQIGQGSQVVPTVRDLLTRPFLLFTLSTDYCDESEDGVGEEKEDFCVQFVKTGPEAQR